MDEKRRDVVLFLLSALLLFVVWGVYAHHNTNRLGAVMDCTTDAWIDYESETGRMPTREIELAWYRDCANRSGGGA